MAQYRRCWIMGAGAIGSVIAGVLHRAARVEVHLVGGSVHAEKVRAAGLVMDTGEKRPVHVPVDTLPLRELPTLGSRDLVVLTCKVSALARICAVLGERCVPDTGIIALQNGMGPERIITGHLGRPIDRGLAFFGANSPEPGEVKYFPGTIRLRPSPVTEAFCALLDGSPIACELAGDFTRTAWLKLAINCVANPLAGILRASNLQLTDPLLDPAKEALLQEVRAAARAEGVTLTVTASHMNRYLSHDNTPSLRTDLLRGLATEIDVINGAVVDVGARHGIPTPVNSLVVSLVHYLETVEGNP